ncbi:ATP-binding SpoIIE family protein phosphatase [Timonella sp. A28]|uniref:ATP-binding SpoIIE family protein phosphatase n=1 Tax=Timonella sp. A28 TaxID=3442640 RepID=UPI003EC07A5A
MARGKETTALEALPTGVSATILNRLPVPCVLVKADFGVSKVVWFNKAFQDFTQRTTECVGTTLEECKITLRREDKTTGTMESWTPTRHSRPTDPKHPHMWTCDVVTTAGQWLLTQAAIEPLTDQENEQYWIIQILPLAEGSEAQHIIEGSAIPALDALSEISTLLTDIEHPNVLTKVSDILTESTSAQWVGFFLEREHLLYSEGLVAARRHRHHTTIKAPVGEHATDTVATMLAGGQPDTIVLDVHAHHPAGTLDALLKTRLQEMWTAEGFAPEGLIALQEIKGRDEVHGILVCAFPQLNDFGLPFTIEDITADSSKVFTTVTRRIAMVIDNIQLYQREHQLAEALQQSMLPTQVDAQELDVWTYYAPSSDHARVGGDWYDILYVDPNTVGVVIGDVVGHDLEAAAAMGQLRSITRSYAYERAAAAKVLERVDRLVDGLGISRPASMVYGRLAHHIRNGVRAWGLEYSRAGHLPPILIRDGEVILLNHAGGGLIGFTPKRRENATLRLRVGDVLVFYTDGLIERRNRPMQVGLQELQETVKNVSMNVASHIGEELLRQLADAPEDDVAIVVVRIPARGELESPGLRPTSVRQEFPAEPSSVAQARHYFAKVCAEWGRSVNCRDGELVVSELVSNAVVHGGGNIVVRFADCSDYIRIEVEDLNPTGPRKLNGHEDRYGGFGIKIVDKLARWGWKPQGVGKVVWAEIPYTARDEGAQ